MWKILEWAAIASLILPAACNKNGNDQTKLNASPDADGVSSNSKEIVIIDGGSDLIDPGYDVTGDIAGGNGALWETDCLLFTDNMFVKHSFRTSGSQIFRKTIYSSDDICTQTLYELAENLVLKSLILFASKGDGFHHMNAELESVILTPITSAQADVFNVAELCGRNNWAAGIGADLSGITCQDQAYPESGNIKQNVIEYFGIGVPLKLGDSPRYIDDDSPRPETFMASIFNPKTI